MPYEVSTFTLPCGARALKAIGTGVITREDADQLMKQIESGGSFYGLPQLYLTQGMEKMSPEARSLFSARTKGGVEQMWSAVVGSSPLIRVTVNFLLRLNRSRSTKMFSAEPEAVAWLDERVREDAARKTAGA
ncbi:MAG TPA: hypothetical protein VFA20_05650 [Myxococcaceae bacterium]|nr:hypothetical protein [Myxococcaceae bacterium]